MGMLHQKGRKSKRMAEEERGREDGRKVGEGNKNTAFLSL